MKRIGGEDLVAGVGIVLIAVGVWRHWSPEIAAVVTGALLVVLGLAAAVRRGRSRRVV